MLDDPISDLTTALDRLSVAGPHALADGESVQALHRQLERLTAITTTAVAAFDGGRTWEEEGARSAAAWIATRCRRSVTAARRAVNMGRTLRDLPATEQAWLDGDIGEDHVKPMVATCRRVGADTMRPDEAQLVGHAKAMGVRQFQRFLAYWEQAVDPDGVEDRAEAQRHARRVHLSQSFEGMWFLDGMLDPINGEILSTTLHAIERELFEADWAAARAVHGDETNANHLTRTPALRRHDALVEMARRAGAVDGNGKRPNPLFTVLVGYETLAGRICELAGGTVVTPGSLAPWLDGAEIERVVFDGPDRVINVGTRRRLFAGATRRAVQVRDRQCYSEFCDVPADQCEVDHVRPWAGGGPTTAENGRPACGYHNRLRHRPP